MLTKLEENLIKIYEKSFRENWSLEAITDYGTTVTLTYGQMAERIAKLNQADATIFQTEKQLAELGDKIPADKKAPIEEALKNLKAAYEKKDADACEAANQALMTAFQAASAEMYNATQGQAGAQPGADFGGAQGAQGGNSQQGAAEDVDFEEVK